MSGLSEDLELNIGPALQAADQLSSALVAAVQSAGPALADALSNALGSVDTAGLSSSLTAAVQGADTSIALAPDTGVLESAISAAVAAADTTVTVTGEASEVTTEITSAVQAAPSTVTLTGDGTELTAEGSQAVQAIDPIVVLQADTSQLEAEGTAAAQAVTEAQVSNVALGIGDTRGIIAGGEEAATAAEGVNALTSASRGLEVANAGLEGSIGGVASAFGPLGAALAGVTAAGAGFFAEAVNETTAAERLKFVFGDLADSIEQVNLPASNFNLSFQQIATTTGASLPGLEQSIARVGAIGNSAGAAAPQIAETAKQIAAIATYLAVTNPALGSADAIANQLTNTLQRGGRAASQLGLSLPTAELNAAAKATAGVGNEVTQFDKIAAGAKIVTDQLGASLGTAVTAGAGEAALAVPRLTEALKETIAAVGAPLIGPITQALGSLEPVLAGLATAIGRVLQAGAPLIGVLGIILRALSDLAGVINAIPLPVLTTAIEAFTAALVIEKVSTFAAGLFTLGANATADVGAIGLLTGAVDSLLTSLGPIGIVIASIGALKVVSDAAGQSNADAATKVAAGIAGIKAGTDLSKESAIQLQQQLDQVNAKLADLRKQNPSGSPLIPTIVPVDGKAQIVDYTDTTKALTAEAARLKAALDGVKTATADSSAVQAGAAVTAQQFGAAFAEAAGKLDIVGSALAAVESANASAISGAVGKLPGVAGVVGDVATAITAAENATASGANAASSAIASQASHAKELRDALAGVAQAQDALNLLRAGPTAEDAAKGELSIATAAGTVQNAEQKVLDTEQALKDLRAGPSANTAALAAENVSKAVLNEQKAILALADARAAADRLNLLSGATDRQKTDAQIKLQEAQFGLTDATRARVDAEAAQKKLTDDSLAGSKAITTAEQAHTDAVNALEAAQLAQQDAQAKQTKLFADALPGSEAYAAAVQKVADAEDRLTQVENTSISTGSRAAKAKEIDTSTAGILAALSKGFDDTLTLEQTFFDNVGKISGEGGQALVDQLLALGPKQGAAEAAALAAATPIVLQGLETKATKLSDAEAGHADQISATFGKALNDSLVREFQTQTANEVAFYANLQTIFNEGGRQLAAQLAKQPPEQAAATAAALAASAPTVIAGLEAEIAQVNAAASVLSHSSGVAVGVDITTGIAEGMSSPSAVHALVLASGGTVQQAIDAARFAAKAQSPSRLFAEQVGQPITQGIAVGITEAQPAVFASLNDLLAASVELASGAIAASKLVATTGVVIPAAVTAAAQITPAQAGSPTQAVANQPSIVNHFNLPPIQDTNALAFAISTRQATAATR